MPNSPSCTGILAAASAPSCCRGSGGTYGQQVVAELARQLTADFGKGWSERQLHYCVRVAEVFPDAGILHTLCSQLSWSHLRLVIQIEDPLKRDFYLEICRVERWSVRQLQERINSLLYGRTARPRAHAPAGRRRGQGHALVCGAGKVHCHLCKDGCSAVWCLPAAQHAIDRPA